MSTFVTGLRELAAERVLVLLGGGWYGRGRWY
jgi:hypothetical protein